MNYRNILFIFVLLVVVSSYLITTNSVENIKQNVLSINEIKISVEIVDSQEERARGLSGKEFLVEDGGMFFIFQNEGVYSFWMKDMNFPIDIIWIDKNFKIVDISHNVSPNTFPKSFSPKEPVLYVLEVNSGFSDKNNIDIGDIVSFTE